MANSYPIPTLSNLPECRQDLINRCLRSLGSPVINIEVDVTQLSDRVDEALQFFLDYNGDATERQYYKYAVTQNDITNRYITLPDNIIGAVDIFPLDSSYSTDNMFDVRYQLALNEMWSLTSVDLVPFYMTYQNIQFIEQLLVGKKPFRYSRFTNNFYIDFDWNNMGIGEYLVINAFQVVDPDSFTKMWADRWLFKYTTALIKRQWGSNLKKYKNASLPGGIQFNGQAIYDEGDEEVKYLEKRITEDYMTPPMDQIY
ncbi:MAG: hypothetical protein P4L79_11125 [Legionella sp.]|uniref:hypothetical protein n=1 Tax=Legionella sp. TaxID=459 RepID=UPI00284EBE16|nr:hypothetical protein [Legionella sp.]